MPRTFVTTLAILCVGLGLSACGGDSDGAADDASADLVAQVNTICDEWQESLDARGEFPVEGFDPENPSADDCGRWATTWRRRTRPGRPR